MIIWLASYPRSGNTLLRTILKQTMDLDSYSEEKIRPIVGLTASAKKTFGHLAIEEPWDAFYDRASSSKTNYLVKTHLPPQDQQAVIYVIRDGRPATESYRAYHHSFQPDPNFCPNQVDLMLGNDFYGNWSAHYRDWAARPNGTYLLVRYEQLVVADRSLLQEIAEFIGYKSEIKPFVNRIETMHQQNPDFFRRGKVQWQRPAHWTTEEEALFLELHGELLLKLEYIQEPELITVRKNLDKLLSCTARAAVQAFSERNAWLHEANKKEQVITKLVAELKHHKASFGDARSLLQRLFRRCM